jgi:hypothetical protein
VSGGDDDPFGRRGEEPGSGIPGGWLPPASGREPEREERPPLWGRPAGSDAGAGSDPATPPPVFERPGARERVPAPSAPPPPGGRKASGSATASLVLGIVGLVVCPLICSVLAIVYGKRARRDIEGSGGRLTGGGNATAGIVLGWIGIGFSVLFLLLVIAGAIALDSDGGSSSGDDPLFSLVRIALA